jgi:hypothetical protein
VNFDNTSREDYLGLSWSTVLTTRAVRETLHLASSVTRPQKWRHVISMSPCRLDPRIFCKSGIPTGSILGSLPILSLVLRFDANQKSKHIPRNIMAVPQIAYAKLISKFSYPPTNSSSYTLTKSRMTFIFHSMTSSVAYPCWSSSNDLQSASITLLLPYPQLLHVHLLNALLSPS